MRIAYGLAGQNTTDGPRSLKRALVKTPGKALAVFLLGMFVADAHAVKPEEPMVPSAASQLPPSHAISYATATNAELDALGSRWGYLSAPERRALLGEVRRRMTQNNGGSSRVRIQATRQFGVVQRPDGTTIRVERRIIRMIPAEQGYGTGFEQRSARDGGALPATPQEAERRALEQQRLQSPQVPDTGAMQDPEPLPGLMPASAIPMPAEADRSRPTPR